jgi:hypothetical protein
MTGSGFGCILRLMFPVLFHYRKMEAPEQLLRKGCVLSRLRNLYYNSNIQRTAAARTPLAGCYTRVFSAKVDVRRNGMGANRAMNLAQCTIFNECFHNLASIHPTKKTQQWLCQNRKDF